MTANWRLMDLQTDCQKYAKISLSISTWFASSAWESGSFQTYATAFVTWQAESHSSKTSKEETCTGLLRRLYSAWQKIDFSQQLKHSINDWFLSFATILDPNRFFTSGPRKIHIEHVLLALSRTGIQDVSCYCYGQKSLYTYFLILDKLPPETLVELDIGFFMENDPNADDPAINLLNPKEPGAFLGTGMQLTGIPCCPLYRGRPQQGIPTGLWVCIPVIPTTKSWRSKSTLPWSTYSNHSGGKRAAKHFPKTCINLLTTFYLPQRKIFSGILYTCQFFIVALLIIQCKISKWSQTTQQEQNINICCRFHG